ncbi:MAG: nickel pincer cofactor biosynthesis protein LarB [Lachnospiraceae bacterium]|nr:nickel pincer cofactor biosynthesis protein LarB [Lachnospiraceae bacterium]
MNDTKKLLEDVRQGRVTVDDALLLLKKEPFTDLGFAKPDMHRGILQGAGEVIYGAGKTSVQIVNIIKAMKESGQENVLITRLSDDKAADIKKEIPVEYFPEAGIAIAGKCREIDGIGRIAVVSAGTSDMRVAEEAFLTARFLGNEVIRIYDAGVAGIHRLFARLDDIMSAKVVIAVAGMEGALASVVGGLCEAPVIAVPTSVGYGASFNGLSALLSMLNSCASGVSVVNIDNGFGAGYQASLINHVS